MKPRRALCLSGGGALGSFIAGVLPELTKVYKYDAVFGVSVGAVNAWGLSTVGAERTLDFWRNLKSPKDVYKISDPVSRLLFKTGLYSLRPLRRNIIRWSYKDRPKIPVWVGITDFKTKKFLTKLVGRMEDIDWIVASSAAPGIYELYQERYGDGGVIDQIPITPAVQMGFEKIDVISTGPTEVQETAWKPEFPKTASVGIRALDIMASHMMADDLRVALLEESLDKLNNKGRKLRIIAPGENLKMGALDFYPDKIAMGIEAGQKRVREFLSQTSRI